MGRVSVTRPQKNKTTRPRSGFWRAFEGSCFVRQTDGDIERTRVTPLDPIVGAYDPCDDDPAVQARTVEQRFEHLFGNQVFERKAGYFQPPPVEHTIANTKVLPHKMAERYTASSKVAPVLVGRKLDAAVASERLQHLDFDQCHLTIEVVFLGVCPESRRVTVALNADAGDQSRLGERLHRRRRIRRNVNLE